MVGTSLTLSASATCGSGEYTYQYMLHDSELFKSDILQDYSSSSSYTCVISFAGTIDFSVNVKDSSGKVVFSNRITVSVV